MSSAAYSHKAVGFDHTPISYARHLARYITDASTIRVNTIRQFGRSPSVEIIRSLMAEENKPAFQRRDMAEDRRWPEDDCKPWRPRGLVSITPPKPKFIEPEPIAVVVANDPVPLKPITPREVIAAIAADYGVKYADLVGKSRLRVFAFPRFAAAFTLVQRGNSQSQAGRFLGGRDHSTIHHACEQFQARAKGNDWAIVRQYYREAEG